MEATDTTSVPPLIASGEKTKARDIIAAIRTLQLVEREQRHATEAERQTLARFGGFGAVALSLFPDPVSGRYKDAGWQALGDELQSLLTPEEYDSAKRTVFNAFYTSPTVIAAMHRGLARLASPATPPCWSPVVALAISWRRPPRGCDSSALSWIQSRVESPVLCIPAKISGSRAFATPSCPRAASTR